MINTELLITAVAGLYCKAPCQFSHAGSQTRQGVHPDFKAFLGENVFLLDLTEVQGLTTCISPLAFSEKLWTYWQMLRCKRIVLFSKRSTVGNQAALMAVGGPGKKILIARNSHRSVVGGLILNGSIPVYLL